MKVIVIILSLMMIAGGIAVLLAKSLKNAAILSGIVSLLAAVFFVFMRAYDVAITEASIGAVLTTALYFFAIKRIEDNKGNEEAE